MWNAGPYATPNVAVGSDLLPTTLFDPGARVGSTVTRVRLRYQFAYDATIFTVDPNLFRIVLALIVLPNTMDAQSIPNPISEGSYDYMAYETIMALEGSSRVDSTAALVLQGRQLDVKSQRRLQEEKDTLWLIWSATDAISSFQCASSVLVKKG